MDFSNLDLLLEYHHSSETINLSIAFGFIIFDDDRKFVFVSKLKAEEAYCSKSLSDRVGMFIYYLINFI
jgi:hypothetical protein